MVICFFVGLFFVEGDEILYDVKLDYELRSLCKIGGRLDINYIF